jgi:uncharacterized protein (DUF849 family)
MDSLIVAVGVNENATRDQNPNIPITAEEIARDIAACVEAGASVFHVHARDERTGEPILNDTQQYIRIFEAIRERCDALVYPSYPIVPTRERYQHVVTLAERGLLEIGPIIASSTNFMPADAARPGFDAGDADYVLYQSWQDITYQMEISNKFGLWISHDVMEPGGVRIATALWRAGWYQHPMLLKFFMSERLTFGLPPEPRFLEAFAATVPEDLDCEWLVLPYGCAAATATALWTWAIEHGGHVRVGVGDNPAGEGYLATNAERVHAIAALANSRGRTVATVADVRARFGAPR